MAKRTFTYLGYYAWWRVGRWLRKKHPRLTWKQINRRYTRDGSFHANGISLLNPGSISVTRYRYRGSKIPTPWNEHQPNPRSLRARRGRYSEHLVLERVQQALARTRNHSTSPWRAGCGGIRTSGSEGSGEETTGRKAGTGASPLTLRLARGQRSADSSCSAH